MIEIEITRINQSYIEFRIIRQDKEDYDRASVLGYETPGVRIIGVSTSCGISIKSSVHPSASAVSDKQVFWIRGCDSRRDDEVMRTSRYEFERIKSALDEFNRCISTTLIFND